MSRPIPAEMKRHFGLVFENTPHLQAIFARVARDNRSVTVYLVVDEHHDDTYHAFLDAESTVEALFPNARFEFRVIAAKKRPVESVAQVFSLQPQFRVY